MSLMTKINIETKVQDSPKDIIYHITQENTIHHDQDDPYIVIRDKTTIYSNNGSLIGLKNDFIYYVSKKDSHIVKVVEEKVEDQLVVLFSVLKVLGLEEDTDISYTKRTYFGKINTLTILMGDGLLCLIIRQSTEYPDNYHVVIDSKFDKNRVRVKGLFPINRFEKELGDKFPIFF